MNVVNAPNLFLPKFTKKDPLEKQIKVAIAALKSVIDKVA